MGRYRDRRAYRLRQAQRRRAEGYARMKQWSDESWEHYTGPRDENEARALLSPVVDLTAQLPVGPVEDSHAESSDPEGSREA